MSAPTPYDGAELVAVLPTADLDRAELWYGRLGFELDATYPDYRVLRAGDTHLHLRLQHDADPARSESGVYLFVASVDDLRRLHANWSAAGARILAEPADQPYGLVEFASEDPDGNLWRFGAPVGDPVAAASAEVHGGGQRDAADVEPATAAGEPDWFAVVSSGHCEECGHTMGEGAASSLGSRLRDEAHRWSAVLRPADDHLVRRRPAPAVWSALEYGAHVRDVMAIFTDRILRTMTESEPELGWWDHEAAIDDGFANESDRHAVGDDLDENAARLAEVLSRVSGDQWERAATRRDHERFTVELMARFALHEVVHHRRDAERSLGATPD